jgi:hypothetical protein
VITTDTDVVLSFQRLQELLGLDQPSPCLGYFTGNFDGIS